MNRYKWILLFISFIMCHQSMAQQVVEKKSGKVRRLDFFNDERPLEMTINTDFRKMQGANKSGMFQPATVTVTLPDSAAITEEITLSARGVFRLQNCIMPGIMVNFKNPTSPKLSNLKKMKLVCGCGSSVYQQQLLLAEYLIYRMYSMLTDMSFKTKLAKVQYKDSKDKMKEYTQYAFFIEDVDDMAARNDCKEISNRTFFTEQTDREQMTLVNMFQYMIGNTDWSVPNMHNIKLIRSAKDTFALPKVVPYDFDFAGLVNAPYAIPHDAIGTTSVTERVYRGFPRTMEELKKVVALFNEKKESFIKLLKDFELIEKKDREIMIKYVNEFYSIINNDRKLNDIFIYNARKL